MIDIPDGTACVHRACLSHKTYPCPFCGRIAGRALTTSERIAIELEKYLADDSQELSNEDFFAGMVEVITPIVEVYAAREVRYVYETIGDAIAAAPGKDISGFSSSAAKSSRPITLMVEPRPWLCMPDRKRVNYLRAAWECLKVPFIYVRSVMKAIWAFEGDIGTGLK